MGVVTRVRRIRIAANCSLALSLALGCSNNAPTYSGAPIASVSLSADASSIIIGQTLQLGIVVLDINGAPVVQPPVLWQSTSSSVATVTQEGLVTGRGQGNVRIRAVSGSARDSLHITVTTNTFDVYTPGETFSPTVLEVPLGATVRFNMFGDEHNADFANVPGRPADIPVVVNVIVSRTFNTRGTFPYDCTVHPGMSGQIVVE
jgi:plastocyanin